MSLALMLDTLLNDESSELRFDIVLSVLMVLALLTVESIVSTVVSERP
jgi:hypothetical protein